LGGTAFIPVGQFDVYRTLKDLGFQFDYGFDQSFDMIAGDIDRLVAIVDFINYLDRFSAQELYDMTRLSSQHNQIWITSGEFYQVCEQQNLQQINKILEVIKNV
jgi:hypothetical protein